MTELDRVRASDAERDAAASRLQEAFAEGRLDDAEFDQRMRTALTAQTRADLTELTADLPEQAPRPLPVPAGRGPGRARGHVQIKPVPGRPLAGTGAVHHGRLQGQRHA